MSFGNSAVLWLLGSLGRGRRRGWLMLRPRAVGHRGPVAGLLPLALVALLLLLPLLFLGCRFGSCRSLLLLLLLLLCLCCLSLVLSRSRTALTVGVDSGVALGAAGTTAPHPVARRVGQVVAAAVVVAAGTGVVTIKF